MPPPGTNLAPLVALGLIVMGVIAAIIGTWTWVIVCWASDRPVLPRFTRPNVPWGPFSVLATIIAWIGVQIGVMLLYGTTIKFLHGPIAKPGEFTIPLRDRLALVGIINLVIVVAVPLLLKLTSRARASDLGLTTRDFGKNAVRGVGMCFWLLPLVYSLMFLAISVWKPKSHPIQQAIFSEKSPAVFAIAAATAVIGAPLAEELLFRGVLLGWFLKLGRRSPKRSDPFLDSEPVELPSFEPFPSEANPYAAPLAATPAPSESALAVAEAHPEVEALPPSAWPGIVANVAASLVFAGLHYEQWPAPVALFVLSMGMGVLYQRTGSLIGPIFLHAMFNGLSTAAMILAASSGIKLPN